MYGVALGLAGSEPKNVYERVAVGLLRKLSSSPAGIYTPGLGYLQTPANLLTYSNDLTNAVWVPENTGSKSGQTLLTPAVGDDVYHGTTVAAGSYTFAMQLSGAGTCSLFAYNATNGIHGVTQITLTSTPTVYVANITSTVANTFYYTGRRTGDTATSITLGGAGLFTGTLTANQIAAMGGIPLTTTTASTAVYTDAHVYLPGSSYTAYGPSLFSAPFGVPSGGYDNTMSSQSATSFSTVGGTSPSRVYANTTATVPGKTYRVTGRLASISANAMTVFARTSAGGLGPTITNTTALGVGDTFSLSWPAASTNDSVLFVSSLSGVSFTVDGFALTEVLTLPTVTSGLTSNNHTLSDGSTGYSSVDGTAGLVLDAMGSVGAELVSNPGPFVNTTGWSLGNGAVGALSIQGSNIRVTRQTAGSNWPNARTALTGLTIGTTYKLETAITNPSGLNCYHAILGAANEVRTTTSTTLTCYFKATATSHYYDIGLWDAAGSVGQYVEFSSASFKPVTGIHATQATTANKPAERRGAYNLALYSTLAGGTSGTCGSGAVAPTGWTFAANTGSVVFSGTSIRFIASAQRPFLACNTAITLPVGVYCFSGKVEAGGAGNTISETLTVNPGTATFTSSFKVNNVAANSSDAVVVGTTISQVITVTVAGTVTLRFGLGCHDSSTGDITMSSPQLEAGSVFTDYSPTTSAAASNAGAGKYWLDDDGTKSLSTGSIPFQMADDHAVIGGLRLGPNATTRYAVNASVGAGSQRVGALYTNASGFVAAGWTDDATATNITSVSAYSGQSVVATAVKQGNSKRLRVNGAQSGATDSTVMGTTTLTAGGAIGDWKSGGGNQWSGGIGPVVLIKGTVPDADLLILERWVASLTLGGPVF